MEIPIIPNLRKKRDSAKNTWDDWNQKLNRRNWDARATKEFSEFFGISPNLFCLIIRNKKFNEIPVPKTSLFKRPDLLLVLLRRLRTGDTFSSLAGVFGGDKTTINKWSNKMLFYMIVVLNGSIKRLENTELQREIMSLRLLGEPCPEIVLIGDGTDIPIEMNDTSFYTYKRNIDGVHATRSQVFISRLTGEIVWLQAGFAPSSSSGHELTMIQDNPLVDFLEAKHQNVKILYDGAIDSIAKNKSWLVEMPTRSEQKLIQKYSPGLAKHVEIIKKARLRIECFFGEQKKRFHILKRAFKGRGYNVEKHAAIFLLTAMLMNLTLKEKERDQL